jgi:hypothetical protein
MITPGRHILDPQSVSWFFGVVLLQISWSQGVNFMWSPTGIDRGTLPHAQMGRHPGQTPAHPSIPAKAGVAFCCRGQLRCTFNPIREQKSRKN